MSDFLTTREARQIDGSWVRAEPPNWQRRIGPLTYLSTQEYITERGPWRSHGEIWLNRRRLLRWKQRHLLWRVCYWVQRRCPFQKECRETWKEESDD